MNEKLRFRHVSGEQVEAEAWVDDVDVPAGEYLMARVVRLEGGPDLLQHRPVGGSQRLVGYERLDNEILAGRRLYRMADWASYPAEVSALYGDESASADPYALFEPYQGQPLRDIGTYIIDDEFDAFVASLLTGLCWIAAAGIAHRAINPDTVRWDSQRRRVHITDFSRSTVFGAPRTPLTGSSGWVPKEQRPSTCYGTVGARDDIWAAGRLVFFVRNQGEDLVHRGQLAESGLEEMFNGLFDRVLGPPEGRPTASELLEDGLRRRVYLPSVADGCAQVIAGREHFLQVRRHRHPGAAEPQDLNADLEQPPSGHGDG